MFSIKEAKKEFIVFVISLLLLLGFICWGVLRDNNADGADDGNLGTASDYPEYYDYDFSDKYYYNQLSPILKREFAKIYYGVQNYQTSIVVNDLTITDLNKIIYILHFDCPELFYLSDSEQNFNHVGEKATIYYPQYIYTTDTVNKMREEILGATIKFKSSLNNSSPAEIEKYIHDYLISNVSYTQETDNCMNIYGAIIEGKGNCKGYSSAFTYLARELGLPSAQVIGYASETDASVGHSWNVVKLNNMYYYIDVCWDDFDNNEKYGGLSGSYIFYNLPANKMALSHNPTETINNLGDPPSDNDSSLIYYKRTGFYAFDLESAQKIIHNGISRIVKGDSTYVILQCDTREVYDSVIKNIQLMIKNEIESQQYGFSGCELVDINKSNTIILTNFSCSNKEEQE